MDQAQEPNIQWRENVEFRHDLFVLKNTQCLKNRSWVKYDLTKIIKKEHKHYYHSFNSKGKPFLQCAPACGHFHEVKTSVDKDGNLVAECGPPLRWIMKKRGRKYIKMKAPILFPADEHPSSDDVTDKHTHEIVYSHSEMLSEHKIQTKQMADQAKLASMKGAITQVEIKAPGKKDLDAHVPEKNKDKTVEKPAEVKDGKADVGDQTIEGLE